MGSKEGNSPFKVGDGQVGQASEERSALVHIGARAGILQANEEGQEGALLGFQKCVGERGGLLCRTFRAEEAV